jgi:RimJ/RimL family protein N-acetyltransferase
MRFEPLREVDLAMLHEWLLRPHVARWWRPAPSIDELRHDYVLPVSRPNATRAYIAHAGGAAIGFIQSYVVKGAGDGWWVDETDPGARGIDPFIADPARLGHGLGSAMVRAFVQRLFDSADVTVVQTDPAPDNARAIRAYLRAGFDVAGPVVTPDGAALLMRCTRR